MVPRNTNVFFPLHNWLDTNFTTGWNYNIMCPANYYGHMLKTLHTPVFKCSTYSIQCIYNKMYNFIVHSWTMAIKYFIIIIYNYYYLKHK